MTMSRNAALAVLSLTLAPASPGFAATQSKPVPRPEAAVQPAPVNVAAHKAAIASAVSVAVTSKVFQLPGGWKLTIRSLEVTQIDNLRVQVRMDARLKKNNQYPIPDASTSGVVRVVFGVGVEGRKICTPFMDIAGLNIHNVQNNLETAARRALNDFFSMSTICVPLP
jgi:hypothetical protein